MSTVDVALDNLGGELEAAGAACCAALAVEGYDRLLPSLPGTPNDAAGWFSLLAGYPENAGSVAAIRQMKAALPEKASASGRSVERGAILQALSVAASEIKTRPVPPAVKRLYATTCKEVAGGKRWWSKFYDERSVHFMELAKLATLNRYPAGDQVFAFYARMPYTSLLKVPPPAVPGMVRQIGKLGGFGPLIMPHINNGRRNQLILQKEEVQRAMWRIAKTMEMNPQVRGLCAAAWFFSAEAAKGFPHLSWLRALYTDEGAYVVDMEPASDESGLRVGSARRRDMHDKGTFYPRRTLVLWTRDGMLDWAARNFEFADPDEEPVAAPGASARLRQIRSPAPAKPAKQNSSWMLWDGRKMISDRPKQYIGLVLLAPALFATVVAALWAAWWLALPVFAFVLIAAWLFQYYFFQ